MSAADRLLCRLHRALDAKALVQLRAEAARLHEENEQLRERLARAEDSAEFWRREATEMHLSLCEARGGSPGITRDGRLVVDE